MRRSVNKSNLGWHRIAVSYDRFGGEEDIRLFAGLVVVKITDVKYIDIRY